MKNIQNNKLIKARIKYQAKRSTFEWKRRKRHKILMKRIHGRKRKLQHNEPFLLIPAPSWFSLIENPDEVLGYFAEAEQKLRNGKNITLDISNVDSLTLDTVTLMVSSINTNSFTHGSIVSGNAPIKPELQKIFTKSGFYQHVQSRGRFSQSQDVLLHKETHRKVMPRIAKKAVEFGVRNVYGTGGTHESMYEILIELMSNTNGHADLNATGTCYWWLYVYNDPVSRLSTYTFLDLGVGIFNSAVVQGFIKKLAKGTVIYPNIMIVDDLLSGKIKSRSVIDNEIRGTGINGIFARASSSCYKSFHIIANDVLIDLKNKTKKQLSNPLNGTLIHWELQNI